MSHPTVRFLLAALLLATPGSARAQAASGVDLRTISHVVIPQSRGFSLHRGRRPVEVTAVRAQVAIRQQAATTTLEVALRNPGGQPAEAVLLLPVPEGAVVSRFAFEGAAAEPTARLLPAGEARRTYDEIVSRLRDPALLEFAGYNLIRSSVFPVPAQGTQRVRITYEQVLAADGNRVDYALPRSESLAVETPWEIAVRLASTQPISMVYSPSHDLEIHRRGEGKIDLVVSARDATEPGPFLLSYVTSGEGLGASLFAYPDPKVDGGYFLLLAGLPARPAEATATIRREVTVVIDRSGSMAGDKMDQVRAAALQVIEGLEEGEAFNIVDYATTVESFAPRPVRKSPETIQKARAYLAALRTTGGTNIHDALVEALRPPPGEGRLPLVLFLTDGLPTVGQTTEGAIREVVARGNPHGRRIFTFGVGADVNVPLLDHLSDVTRGTPTYVLPGEDVEVKVAQVYRRLYGPVLAGPDLTALDPRGEVTTRAVQELIPDPLPDLFEGEQLVLLGQYHGEEPLHLRLKGNYLGKERAFDFQFDLSRASTRNSFVPRLWAGRRIALLVDQIRQQGAALASSPQEAGVDPFQDPRFRELTDEILRLSTEFGILTEYTAFLATEGTDLAGWERLLQSCGTNLNDRAVRKRSGLDAVNQGVNFNDGKQQSKLNRKNRYWDEKLELVEFSSVQQICDRAFFRQGDTWVDSHLVGKEAQEPDEVVAFGSPRHHELLEELLAQRRQGLLSLPGEILLSHQNRRILVQNSETKSK